MTNLTARFHYIVRKRGFRSINALSGQLGFLNQTFNTYLTGLRPWPPKLKKQIARLLNVDYDWLFSDEDIVVIPEYKQKIISEDG